MWVIVERDGWEDVAVHADAACTAAELAAEVTSTLGVTAHDDEWEVVIDGVVVDGSSWCGRVYDGQRVRVRPTAKQLQTTCQLAAFHAALSSRDWAAAAAILDSGLVPARECETALLDALRTTSASADPGDAPACASSYGFSAGGQRSTSVSPRRSYNAGTIGAFGIDGVGATAAAGYYHTRAQSRLHDDDIAHTHTHTPAAARARMLLDELAGCLVEAEAEAEAAAAADATAAAAYSIRHHSSHHLGVERSDTRDADGVWGVGAGAGTRGCAASSRSVSNPPSVGSSPHRDARGPREGQEVNHNRLSTSFNIALTESQYVLDASACAGEDVDATPRRRVTPPPPRPGAAGEADITAAAAAAAARDCFDGDADRADTATTTNNGVPLVTPDACPGVRHVLRYDGADGGGGGYGVVREHATAGTGEDAWYLTADTVDGSTALHTALADGRDSGDASGARAWGEHGLAYGMPQVESTWAAAAAGVGRREQGPATATASSPARSATPDAYTAPPPRRVLVMSDVVAPALPPPQQQRTSTLSNSAASAVSPRRAGRARTPSSSPSPSRHGRRSPAAGVSSRKRSKEPGAQGSAAPGSPGPASLVVSRQFSPPATPQRPTSPDFDAGTPAVERVAATAGARVAADDSVPFAATASKLAVAAVVAVAAHRAPAASGAGAGAGVLLRELLWFTAAAVAGEAAVGVCGAWVRRGDGRAQE